jgi:membrane fusion protein (multidrug efflux system)
MTKAIVYILLAASLGISACVIVANNSSDLEITNAFVSGQILKISATRNGVARNLKVSKGDRVEQGDLLFTIDAPEDSNIDLMTEHLRAAIAEELERCMQMSVAETDLSRQGLELEFAENQKKSFNILSKTNAIPRNQVDSNKLAVEVLSATLEQARRNLEYKRHQNRVPIMQRSSTRLAAERLREGYVKRDLGNIYAPYSGYIYEVLVYPGGYVEAGQNSLVLVPDTELIIEANVLETQLSEFRSGTVVRIVPDTLGAAGTLKGVIHSTTPAVSAAFSPFPRNNSDSTWIKVSQRVPVLIKVEDFGEQKSALPLGSSVKVIVSGRAPAKAQTLSAQSAPAARARTENAWEAEYDQKVSGIFVGETRGVPKELLKACNR